MISGFPSSDILHSTALGVEAHVSSAAAGTCLPPTDATAAQQPRWRRHQALASGVCDSGALACSSICAAVSRCSARSMFRMQRSQAEPFLARTCPIMSGERQAGVPDGSACASAVHSGSRRVSDGEGGDKHAAPNGVGGACRRSLAPAARWLAIHPSRPASRTGSASQTGSRQTKSDRSIRLTCRLCCAAQEGLPGCWDITSHGRWSRQDGDKQTSSQERGHLRMLEPRCV